MTVGSIMHEAQRRLGSFAVAGLVTAAVVLTACGGGASSATAAPHSPTSVGPVPTVNVAGIPADVGKDDTAQFTGAGSTFAAPLYTRWFVDYKSDVAPGVRGNYQAIGSGGGIQNIIRKTIDFGATDAPMTDAEMAKAPGIQHIPTALGAVAVTYNVDGISRPLRLDGATLAKIYLGAITKWNDPAIAHQNPGVDLPDTAIIVVHRSDGSGTSYAFTDYLSKVSDQWDAKVGRSKNPQWPLGLGGQGNDGVTQQVKQNQNSIGYVDLIFADKNNLPVSEMKNASGEYVAPTIASTTAAAEGVALSAD
jgi:phosphate transport system substrate-binding protein